MEEMVGEIYLTKTIDNHNISFGTFMSNTKASDNNWISSYVGDFRNAPRMVNISYVDTSGNTVNFSPGGFITGNQTANRYHESRKVAFFIGDEIKGEKFNWDQLKQHGVFLIRIDTCHDHIQKSTDKISNNTFIKVTLV